MTVPKERIPYVDRPAVIAEFCTCPVDAEGERERGFIERLDADGCPVRDWYHLTNPTCPLHGDTTEGSPF